MGKCENIKSHTLKNNKWKISSTSRTHYMHDEKINEDAITNNIYSRVDELYFYDFDMALLSKVALIRLMEVAYIKAIDELKEKLYRNVPNTDDIWKELKEKYPI